MSGNKSIKAKIGDAFSRIVIIPITTLFVLLIGFIVLIMQILKGSGEEE